MYMGICYLCEKEDRSYFGYYCEKCNKIKRLIHLYGLERVSEILECVLIRTKTQQTNKIKNQLEIEQETLKTSHEEHADIMKKVLRSGKELK